MIMTPNAIYSRLINIAVRLREIDEIAVDFLTREIDAIADDVLELSQPDTSSPVPMLLTCPTCSARHIDDGVFATKPHHTHACQKCGMCWRPAVVPTCGVQFLPGFKNGGAR